MGSKSVGEPRLPTPLDTGSRSCRDIFGVQQPAESAPRILASDLRIAGVAAGGEEASHQRHGDRHAEQTSVFRRARTIAVVTIRQHRLLLSRVRWQDLCRSATMTSTHESGTRNSLAADSFVVSSSIYVIYTYIILQVYFKNLRRYLLTQKSRTASI